MNAQAKFKTIDAERYDWLLGCVPPAVYLSHGFLVGEAYDHNDEGRPRYTACFCTKPDAFEQKIHGLQKGYFESVRPMTIAEFRAVKLADIKANLIDAAA